METRLIRIDQNGMKQKRNQDYLFLIIDVLSFRQIVKT
ncbi:hypothetical protein WCLE_008110 [Wolbachia endosymbiont of Cimex lectularius]|nr:hypothetical protein WCLE_008110 [Wolbachia endosymbiont of Cimex lectularius]